MIPPSIKLAPIDDGARNGNYQLLFSGQQFAVARWADDRWVFSNGVELHFTPSAYRLPPPREDVAA